MSETNGGRRLGEQKTLGTQIESDLARARKALNAERFDQVVAAAERAQARSAEAQLFGYFPEIDRLQDAAHEGSRAEAEIEQLLRQVQAVAPTDARNALSLLKGALNGLALSGSPALGARVASAWDPLWRAQPLPSQIDDVRQFFEAQNFREAHRLVEILQDQYPGHSDVLLWQNRVNRQWDYLQKQLAQAILKLDEGDLPAAVESLRRTRQTWPQNPDARWLWAKGHINLGLERSAAGRRALQAESFEAAAAAFEAADQAFRSAGDAVPEHPSARAADDEATALLQVAIQAAQAQHEQRKRHWEAARQIVDAAFVSHTAACQARGHSLGDVAAVLTALQTRTDDAIAAIANAGVLLAEGQQFLADGAFDRAQHRFQQGLQLIEQADEPLAQALIENLRQTEVRQSEVFSLLEQAQGVTDPDQRLQILGEAFARWPGAPGLADRLLATLSEAAGATTGADARVIAWCERMLALPESDLASAPREQAAALLHTCTARRQVAAWLGEADALQAELDQASLPAVTGYQQLVEILRSAQQDALRAPECLPDVELRLLTAEDRLARVARADDLLRAAEDLRRGGEWSAAAVQIAAASTALEDLRTAWLTEQAETWQRIASTLEATLQAAGAALSRAQEQYQATANAVLSSSLSELASRWTEIRGQLAATQGVLAAPPAEAEPLPAAWGNLQAATDDLGARCLLLQQASESVRLKRTDEALARLAEAVERYPDDPALAPFRDRVLREATAAAQQQARTLLDAAHAHIQAGELADAQIGLDRVEQLQLIAAETAAERRGLRRKIILWSQVEQLIQVGMATGPEIARKERLAALYDLLQATANDDGGLPAHVRGLINTLLGLKDAQLHREAPQQAGRQLCDAVAQAALENHLVQEYVLPAARGWLDLVSQQAYEGFIFAQSALGDYEQAYTIAKQAVDRHPDTLSFLEQADEARQHIQRQLRDAVQIQIARARELQGQGAFTEALAVLDSTANATATLGQRVERDFPEVTREDTRLTALKQEADDLGRAVLELQALSAHLTALIVQARSDYAAGDLQGAAQRLAEVRLLDQPERAKGEWRDWQLLHDAVEADRQAAAQTRVRTALDRARLALETSRTTADLQQVLADLDAVRPAAVQLEASAGPALVLALDALVTDAQSQLLGLADVAHARETAATAAASQAFQRQLAALERAAQAARGQDLEAIRAEIDGLRPLAERQRQAQEAWEQARIAFERGDFRIAHDYLATAQELGATEPMLRAYREAARAGLLLHEAKALLPTDPRGASSRLRKVLAITADCVPAASVQAEAQEHLTQLQADEQQRQTEAAAQAEAEASQRREQEAQQKRITSLLRGARSALRKNQLEDARRDLTEIFAVIPAHAEAEGLWEQLDRAGQANALVERARELHKQGDYETALELVQRASVLAPDMVEAQELPVRLLAEREAGLALTRALSLADEKRFSEARGELRTAWERNSHHPQLLAVEGQLQAAEQQYWDATCRAAEDALARRDYRTALWGYRELAAHFEPAEVQSKLAPLQQVAVDQWCDWIIAQSQDALPNQNTSLEGLVALQNDIREVLSADAGPASQKRQVLDDLAHQLDEARLRRRLAEGNEALHRNLLAQAEAIGHELEEVTANGEWPGLDFLVVKLNEDVKRAQERQPDGEGAAASAAAASAAAASAAAAAAFLASSRLSAEAEDQLFAETLAALNGFDLEAAQRCLEVSRQEGVTGERWADAAARLEAAQAAALDARTAMAAGWDNLRERDFGAAQAAFAAISQSVHLEEPIRWYQYARCIQQAIALVLQLEDEAAAAQFADAEVQLRLRSSEADVTLWGERLAAERRWALFYAQTLREEVTGMITDRRLKDQLKAQHNSSAAADMLRKLIQRQENFPRLVNARIEPPDDFAAAVIDGVASQG
jgi:hypothetical protein